MYCDKGKDDEILSKLHNSSNTQPNWHGPKPIGMSQNKTSFKASAHVPFTAICSYLSSGLTCWVHSHAVKVPVTSTTKVSFSVISASKIVASVNYGDAKTNNALSFRHTASSTLQLVVASVNDKFSKGSNKLNNASSFVNKSSLAFHLVVASVDWKSKAISNKPFRTLCHNKIKSKMPFIFQLIVGFKQMHQTKLQQVQVDAWLSNSISGHGPDSHQSNCASQLATPSKCLKPHKSSCASKVARAKCLKSNKSICASKVARAKCLKSHESSCASKVARAKCLNS
jgi:hypothetical protein